MDERPDSGVGMSRFPQLLRHAYRWAGGPALPLVPVFKRGSRLHISQGKAPKALSRRCSVRSLGQYHSPCTSEFTVHSRTFESCTMTFVALGVFHSNADLSASAVHSAQHQLVNATFIHSVCSCDFLRLPIPYSRRDLARQPLVLVQLLVLQ